MPTIQTSSKPGGRPAAPVPAADHDLIVRCIHLIRGSRVMLDMDLARLYGVTTGNLNKAVRRNQERFPEDFMFVLSGEEFDILKFQNGRTTSHGGRRSPPLAFTREGVAMRSGVLRSGQAVRMNVTIMRAFIRMQSLIASQAGLAGKLSLLEKRVDSHDDEIRTLLNVLQQRVEPPPLKTGEIGFHTKRP